MAAEPAPHVRRRGAGEPFSVVIAGGGFAALEAGLALRALAGDAVRLTFVAPEPILHYRPAATLELLDVQPPRVYDLREIARHLEADLQLARLESVLFLGRGVRLSSGTRLDYDALVLAIGSRVQSAIPGASIFRDQRDVPALRRRLDNLMAQSPSRLVLAVPSGVSWPLPLYEVALVAATHAARRGADLEVALASPEATPLEVFGDSGSRAVAALLDEHDIAFSGHCTPVGVRRDGALQLAGGGALAADHVVSVPQLGSRRIPGIPASWWGFVPTDRCGRVQDRDDIYAAGDMTAFPVKQGGLAAQQADRVAHTIARGLDLPVKELDDRLVLQARLAGGRAPLFLRTELDWQGRPTAASTSHPEPPGASVANKVHGRYLAPYLEQLQPHAA